MSLAFLPNPVRDSSLVLVLALLVPVRESLRGVACTRVPAISDRRSCVLQTPPRRNQGPPRRLHP